MSPNILLVLNSTELFLLTLVDFRWSLYSMEVRKASQSPFIQKDTGNILRGKNRGAGTTTVALLQAIRHISSILITQWPM